jgi:acetyltransferase-like isoleucine patch superfamily enzyme
VKESGSLFESLVELYQELRLRVREKWKRDLPFGELLSNRWERAKSLGFGEGTSIYHDSYVYGDVKVGKNCWIGPHTILDGSGGLEIGNYCSISAGVHIYTHDSVKWAVSGGMAAYERAPVRIGNCCHIGARVVIVKGANIGDHCVIGAGAFVNSDIPAFSIAVGEPCRVIGKVQISTSGDVRLDYSPLQ